MAIPVPDDAAPSTLEDRRLIRAFADGDKAAGEVVIRAAARLVQDVVRLVRDASWQADLLQDVLKKVWEQREVLATVGSVEGYVVTMARNHAVSFLRKAWHRELVTDGGEELPALLPTPETAASGLELRGIVEAYMSRLPEDERRTLESLLAGNTIAETSRALDVPRSAVKSVIARMLRHLTSALAKGRGNA